MTDRPTLPAEDMITARVRMPRPLYEAVRKAAELSGQSYAEFVIAAQVEKARVKAPRSVALAEVRTA